MSEHIRVRQVFLIKNAILLIVAKCFGLKQAVFRLVVQNVQRNIKIYYSDLKAVLKSQSFHVQVVFQHRIILSSSLSPIYSIYYLYVEYKLGLVVAVVVFV